MRCWWWTVVEWGWRHLRLPCLGWVEGRCDEAMREQFRKMMRGWR